MGLHTCLHCDGSGELDAYYYGNAQEEGIDFISCEGCDGKGELTECQCCAYEPFECICGAWDDVDIDEWYRDDMMEEE